MIFHRILRHATWPPATVTPRAFRPIPVRSFCCYPVLAKEPDFEAARKWFAEHGEWPIQSEIGEVSYARSSGPGGQNVNK